MWGEFFEHCKNCNRYWAFAILAGAAILPVLFLVAAASEHIPPRVIFAVVLAFFLTASFLAMRQNRPPRLGRMPPLGRDDCRVARSKLLNSRSKH